MAKQDVPMCRGSLLSRLLKATHKSFCRACRSWDNGKVIGSLKNLEKYITGFSESLNQDASKGKRSGHLL